MNDTPQLSRLKRTRERIQEVLRMTRSQEDALLTSLREVSAAIEELERAG